MFSRVSTLAEGAGGGVGVTERSAGDGAGVGVSGAVRSGVGVATRSGAGVVSSVVSSESAKRFSYQTTRSSALLADTKSRSPSPSRSAAIT